MKIYLVTWPDDTFSIITAQDKNELFWNMDLEGDPTYPKVKIHELIPNKSGHFHLSSEFVRNKLKFFPNAHTDTDAICRLKRFRFGPDFEDEAYYKLMEEKQESQKSH